MASRPPFGSNADPGLSVNLRRTAVSAVGWSAVQLWGSRVVSLVIFMALARLIEPQAFGLLALVTVFTAFIEIFVAQGFGDAIVQRGELEDEHLDTAFWTGILMGGALMAVGILAAPAVAGLVHEPRLSSILRWLSVNFIFVALSSTQQAILRRRLAFKELAVRSLIAIIAGGVIGLVMAVNGFGVWSLVAQMLSAGFVGVLVLWGVSGWRPRFRFSRRHFRELFSFGVHVSGVKVLNFFSQRSDDFLIGVFLGPVALGYYTVAYRLSRALTNLLTGVTSAVALPTFSRLQGDPERMRRGFYTATAYTSLITFPAFLGIAALAPELVPLLFGPSWEASIPVTRVLAFIGILHSLQYFDANVITAAGKPSWRLAITAVYATANVLAFAIAVRWGIAAVAAAYVIRGYVLSPISLLAVKRLIGIDLRTYLRQFAAPLMASLLALLVVLLLKASLGEVVELYARTAAYILAGGLTYVVTIDLIARSNVRGLLRVVREAVPRLASKKA